MLHLGRADLEGVLGFVADVGGLDFARPYPVEVLERLAELVPCDAVTYQEVDIAGRRFLDLVAIGPDGDLDGGDGEDVYWSAGPCPIFDHRIRHRDLRVVALSDLISPRQFHRLPLYLEYFRHYRVEHMLDLGLAAPTPHYRSLVLFRRPDERDFSPRDRAVLEALRPHLYRLEQQAALRRRLAEALGGQDADERDDGVYAGLTPREREIVELVAEGKTNAEIAAVLWIAPSTVKKHLEHVYGKLGVRRRAAVAAAHSASGR